jgi:hypothetical protein
MGTYLGCESCGLVHLAEELGCFLALVVADFGEVKEANRRTAPDDPVSIVLYLVSEFFFLTTPPSCFYFF